MIYIISLLTVVMVLDCVLLILLVLIQLPKKEAGAGLAFGGGATDALFGAGSGNVLTKITKYAATTFFSLALVLAILQSRFHNRAASELEQRLSQPAKPIPQAGAPIKTPNTTAASAPQNTLPSPKLTLSNAPSAAAIQPEISAEPAQTNAAPPAPK
jgi:preprotein translocase subunit SecG